MVQWKITHDLKLVYHLSELRAPHDGIDIVAVPGLWAEHIPEKESNSCSWLKLLAAFADHDTRIFIFKYDINPQEARDGKVWQQLLWLGRVLADALRQARPLESRRRPLYFICHSLGGILLKQALCLVHQTYPDTRNALSGIIFLGSPHLTAVDDTRWQNWDLILKLFRRDLPKTPLQRGEIEMLASVCEKFSGLNLKIPILSVFEKRDTKIREVGGPLGRFRRVEKTLVDLEHASLKLEHEELLGVDMTHSELELVNYGTDLFDKLVSYLKKAPTYGLAVVTDAYQRLDIEIESSDARSQTTAAQRPQPIVEGAEGRSGGTPFTMTDDPPKMHHVLLPCYSLEQPRNRNFFGQEQILDLIDQTLLPSEAPEADSSSPRAFSICGMGGLGKTELAIEYIHSRKAKFDAIFWINGATTQKLHAGYRDIALKLGLLKESTVVLDDPEGAREIVKRWLVNPVKDLGQTSSAEISDVKWMIVFDNIEDTDILFDFWPDEGVGSILITSRNPLAKQAHYAQLNGIDLAPMAFDTAGRLLQKISLRQEESSSLEVCTMIAERLGGLPLAVVQMAHLIRMKHLSLVEFIEYYDHDTKAFQETSVPGLTKQQTIASIWNIESLPDASVALLRVLCMLDPDMIHEEILTKGAEKVELANYPQSKPAYFEARQALIKSSLISRNMELGFLKIHRLVQEVVRQKLSLEDFQSVYNAAVILISEVWPFVDETNLNKADRLLKVRRYSPQVIAIRFVLEEKTVDKLKPDFRVSGLFNEMSWTYILQSWGYNLRDGAEFAALSQKVLQLSEGDADERVFTKLLADSYRYQGITATYMGTDLAVPSDKKWISLLVERVAKYQDPVDINTLPIAYNEIGMALMRVPDQEEAVRSWKLSCDTLGETTKSGELPFPFPWVHRALILTYYSGDPDSADDLIKPILKEREKKLGKDDTSTIETGFILSFMGNIRRAQDRPDDAFSFHQRGADALKTTTGERSAFTTQAYYRLARDHFERKEYQEASTLLEKCISFAGDIPWYLPEAARANWKQGHTVGAMGGKKNAKRSEELLERAMHLRHKLDPDDTREEPELVDEDWDRLVYYYNR